MVSFKLLITFRLGGRHRVVSRDTPLRIPSSVSLTLLTSFLLKIKTKKQALCGYSKKKKIRKTAIEGLLPTEFSRILSLEKKQKLN